MADDELDALYWIPPDQFTAERRKLSAAAKQRGDTDAAKRISAARKPTTAAWIVNRLVLGRRQARASLAELGESLRTAHAALDGVQIRELSARQHHLVTELTDAAFDAAEVRNPSAAVRDDVAGTLQAAIADPDVRARLGRLVKAERWSGFGDFGDSAAVSAATQRTAPADKPSRPAKTSQRDQKVEAARREKLTAAVAAAERTAAQADSVLSARRAERDAARTRRDQAAADLSKAERALASAGSRYEKARRDGRDAANALQEARAQLRQQK